METNTKKITVLIIVLAIVAVAVIVVSKIYKPKTSNNQVSNTPQAQTEKQKIVGLTEVKTDQLPENFPSDIPLEKGAEVINNFDTTNPLGQALSGREFVSKLTMAANLKLYEDALKANGWTIVNTVDQKDQKILEAVKDKNNLRIRIYTDAGKVRVFIQNTVK